MLPRHLPVPTKPLALTHPATTRRAVIRRRPRRIKMTVLMRLKRSPIRPRLDMTGGLTERTRAHPGISLNFA